MVFGRKRKTDPGVMGHSLADRDSSSGDTLAPYNDSLSKSQVKRATRTRKIWALLTSLFLLISVVFMILVEIGNTYDKPVIRDTWFLKLNLENIIPQSTPNSVLINTIAQSLGLHDFYQVGLWNFCEGYVNEGITYCSKPKALYWFNPVQILYNELLAGASIALPADIINALNLLKKASQWMFGIFLSGTCIAFVMMFLTPLSIYSRWLTLPVSIFTFLAALLITVGAVLGTVIFIVLKNAATSVADLNIGASLGEQMFAFMWVASAFSILAWLIQMGLCCCCASRRDVKRGKKRGSKHAYENSGFANDTEKRKRGIFGRRKAAA